MSSIGAAEAAHTVDLQLVNGNPCETNDGACDAAVNDQQYSPHWA